MENFIIDRYIIPHFIIKCKYILKKKQKYDKIFFVMRIYILEKQSFGGK